MKKVCLLGLACLLAVALAVPCGAWSFEAPQLYEVSSYDEYRELVSSSSWPADFVRYEDIQELGEFAGFLYSLERDPLRNYTYVLTDDSGHEVTLTIDGPSYWLDEVDTVTDEHVHKNDMRVIGGGSQKSVYLYDGITYMYGYRKLDSIVWQYEGVEYKVTADFTEYGGFMDTTAVGKLLNLDTAREMADQISAPYDGGIQDIPPLVLPPFDGGGLEEDTTTAAPFDETTRSDEQDPTWFDRHSNAIWAIVISTSVIGVAVTFGVLSRKGWRI